MKHEPTPLQGTAILEPVAAPGAVTAPRTIFIAGFGEMPIQEAIKRQIEHFIAWDQGQVAWHQERRLEALCSVERNKATLVKLVLDRHQANTITPEHFESTLVWDVKFLVMNYEMAEYHQNGIESQNADIADWQAKLERVTAGDLVGFEYLADLCKYRLENQEAA